MKLYNIILTTPIAHLNGYVIKAAGGSPLTVLGGMEVTTKEEAHVLAIFESLDDLKALEAKVCSSLTGENDEKLFGCQAIVNEQGEVLGFNSRLLINATGISLADLTGLIHSLRGIAIASHIDRPYYSVLSQLGFIPEDAAFDALEISASLKIALARKRYPALDKYRFIASSDAHYLRDIGRAFTGMRLEQASFAEIRMALEGKNGRCIAE